MAITDLVPVPGGLNPGVLSAKQATMLALLGNPRTQYSDECQEVTNPALRPLFVTDSVGPFRVTGLKPAVISLRGVLADVAREAPLVHAALGSAGMFCARLVRGSQISISNHSWGTAVDVRLNGLLDRRGDGLVQRGLIEIAPIFNRQGWFWGAGFRTEDAMHFEAGDDLVRKWSAEGRFGTPPAAPARLLIMGDRGPEVAAVQKRLNAHGAQLTVDGIFGLGTRGAVASFQAASGLPPDGVVGPSTLKALELE